MFACCCGVGVLSSLLAARTSGVPREDEIRDCWFYGKFGVENVYGEYVIPKTGYWVLSISSYGADVNEAQNMAVGTAYYVGHFNKGETIEYRLANRKEYGSLISQAMFRDVFLNSKTLGVGQQQAAFMLRWIGNDLDLLPAKLVAVNDVRRLGGDYVKANVFPDGTDVFALNGNRVIAPSVGDWAKMTANKAHWYMQDVVLNQVGTHQVYVLGDDHHRLAVNGVPVVWSSDEARESGNVDLLRGYGQFNVSRVGVHQFMVMQVNVPADTPSWTSVVVKQPDGSLLDLLNGWQYIENTYKCENNFNVPDVVFTL